MTKRLIHNTVGKQFPTAVYVGNSILVGGMNPVAAVEEAGIEVKKHAISTVIDYKELVKIQTL
ncbi:NrpR regulatory domain-containing protein [Chloroflexota bacterium]